MGCDTELEKTTASPVRNGGGGTQLAAAFERERQRATLVAFVTAGYPSAEATPGILDALVEGGAGVIELGVPFSDPVADGPAIQRASEAALAKGMDVPGALRIVAGFRDRWPAIPLVMMGYSNPLLSYGLDKFGEHARRVGVDGMIIVDVPADCAQDWKDALGKHGIALIPLVSPTTTEARMRLIAEQAEGFVYCVSLKGVTGSNQFAASDTGKITSRLRELSQLPVVVGFGVRTPEQARQAAAVADGVAVGSGLAELIAACDAAELPGRVRAWAKGLADACAGR